MSLAIFDLDNTLIGGDSDHAWGEFLCKKGIVDTDAYRRANDYFYEQYKSGGLDIHEYLEFALRPLAEHDMAQLTAWHAEFMREMIAPIIQVAAFNGSDVGVVSVTTASGCWVMLAVALGRTEEDCNAIACLETWRCFEHGVWLRICTKRRLA